MGQCKICGIALGCERVWKNPDAKYVSCVSYTPPRPTNADQIRAKSDLELAEWLQERGCDYCPARNMCIQKPLGNCLSTILEWLQQEIEDG